MIKIMQHEGGNIIEDHLRLSIVHSNKLKNPKNQKRVENALKDFNLCHQTTLDKDEEISVACRLKTDVITERDLNSLKKEA